MVDSYSNWVLTPDFANNSQAALNSGKQIEWISVKSSDDNHNANDLVGFNNTTLSTANIMQTTPISTVGVKSNTVTITGVFNNTDNTADYYIRTLFLVAKYNGNEFLAAASVANSAGSAFRMPGASTTEITEFTTRPQISVTNASSVSTTVNPVSAATNERVDQLEKTVHDEVNSINKDKETLWNKLNNYVSKTASDTITGIKTFSETIIGSITGNAGSATKLQKSKKIGGVDFDGTTDISLPGVNKAGNQDTSGKANSANKLTTPRKLSLSGGATGSSKFDGSSDIIINVDKLDSTAQKPKVLEYGTDLDVLTVSGLYVSNGKTLVNAPTTSNNTYASIILINNDANDKNSSMIYQDTNTNRIWIRQRARATYQPWIELFRQGDAFQGDLLVNGPDVKKTRIGLVTDDFNMNSGLIRYSGLDVTGNGYQGITLLSDTGNIIIGGGEGASYLAELLSKGGNLGSLTDYGFNANNERAYIGGDGGVVIIPNLSAFQNSTPDKAIFWEFKNDGTVRTPNGKLLQEVNDSSTQVYGLGKVFDSNTYLTFIRSGKIVTVYGKLKIAIDISSGLNSYINESIIPVEYRPFSEFKGSISHNSSDGLTKLRGDFSFNRNGLVSIDDLTIGNSNTMTGTIPAGTEISLNATWVMT